MPGSGRVAQSTPVLKKRQTHRRGKAGGKPRPGTSSDGNNEGLPSRSQASARSSSAPRTSTRPSAGPGEPTIVVDVSTGTAVQPRETGRSTSSRSHLLTERVREKLEKQRIRSLGRDVYKRLYQRALQKYQGVSDSFIHVFELDTSGRVPFSSFWKVIQQQYDGTITKAEALEIFKIADTDDDGAISINEIQKAYSAAEDDRGNGGVNNSSSRPKKKRSGRKPSKFLTGVLDRIRSMYQDKASLNAVFLAADEDHNGYVSELEMQNVLKGMGISSSLGDCGNICDYFDADQDGMIRYDEFVNFILGETPEVHDAVELEQHAESAPEGLKEMKALKERLKRSGFDVDKGLQKKAALMDVSSVSAAIREKYRKRNSLRDVFREWDEDKDGVITKKELSNILFWMGFEVEKKSFKQLYSRFDRDDKKGISYDEFVEFIFPSAEQEKLDADEKQRNKMNKMLEEAERIKTVVPGTLEEARLIHKMKQDVFQRMANKGKGTLQEAFRKFDKNRDGILSYDEFRTGMKGMDPRLTDAHIDVMLGQFDKDRSGFIDYTEFVKNVSEVRGEDGMFSPMRCRRRQNASTGLHDSRPQSSRSSMSTGRSGASRSRFRRRPVTASLQFASERKAQLAYCASFSNMGALPPRPTTVNSGMRKKRGRFIVPKRGTFREQNFPFRELYSKVSIPTKNGNTPVFDTSNLIHGPLASSSKRHHHAQKFSLKPLSRHTGKRRENIEQRRSDVSEKRRWGRQTRKKQNESRLFDTYIKPNRYLDEDNAAARVNSKMRQTLMYYKALEHRFEEDAATAKVAGFHSAADTEKNEERLRKDAKTRSNNIFG